MPDKKLPNYLSILKHAIPNYLPLIVSIPSVDRSNWKIFSSGLCEVTSNRLRITDTTMLAKIQAQQTIKDI